MQLSRQKATLIALQAFSFLGEDERRLEGLFALTGIDAAAATQALVAEEDAFLGAIMDYLMSSENWAQAFGTANDYDPQTLASTARVFGAGQLMDN